MSASCSGTGSPALDFHAGIEMIIHPWGTPLHLADTESPDDQAHTFLGQRMTAFGGPYSGFYPVGTSNDLLGAVHGPLDDTSYATSWDAANADPLWPTNGWRSLAYTVEISNAKQPPASTLGGDAALLIPGGPEDGYVPKNVRIALAAIDIAEPYIVWTNRSTLPAQVEVGEPITVEWQVRGCFEVDETRVRFGTASDPLGTYDGETPAQADAADPCFDPADATARTFSAEVSFAEPGVHYLTPVAQVDTALLTQSSPDPAQTPRSWLVRSRTEEGFYFENTVEPTEVNTVTGHLFWGAAPLSIEVTGAAIFADGFESGNTSAWSATIDWDSRRNQRSTSGSATSGDPPTVAGAR